MLELKHNTVYYEQKIKENFNYNHGNHRVVLCALLCIQLIKMLCDNEQLLNRINGWDNISQRYMYFQMLIKTHFIY